MSEPPISFTPNCGSGIRLILGCGQSSDSFLLITKDFVTGSQKMESNGIKYGQVLQNN